MTRKQEFIKQYVANYMATYYASHLKDDSVITPNETDFVANMSIKSAEKVWNTLNEKEFFGTLDEVPVEVKPTTDIQTIYRIATNKRKYASNPIVRVTLDDKGKEQEEIVCLFPVSKKIGDELAEQIVELLNRKAVS